MYGIQRLCGGYWTVILDNLLMLLRIGLAWCACSFVALSCRAADFAQLHKQYSEDVLPLLKARCLTCHSTAKREGELDLEQLQTIQAIRGAAGVWQKAIDMLDTREMPPREAPQLSDSEQVRLKQWLQAVLDAEAEATAGDPGPVVLRRLNNVEYTNTVRTLTGQILDPAREFPADSAAGEGFTNSGAALVMSPAMLGKYMTAAKEIAEHGLLLRNEIRFSPYTTRRDWSDDVLRRIRSFYGRYTDESGSTRVNLQGLQWDTNAGGRLPLERYILALHETRVALAEGKLSITELARTKSLNEKYLHRLWDVLRGRNQSMLLQRIADQFQQLDSDNPASVESVVSMIRSWQQALTRFQSVGHMKPWLAAVEPLADQSEIKLNLGDQLKSLGDSTVGQQLLLIDLAASVVHSAGDRVGVIWKEPRLVAAGRRDISVRDAERVYGDFQRERYKLFGSISQCLAAAHQAMANQDQAADLPSLARQYSVDERILAAWFETLSIDYLTGAQQPSATLSGLYTNTMRDVAGYAFVNGWGSPQTPSILASSGDAHVRIPGNMKPGGVVVHPSPELSAIVTWRSPFSGQVNLLGTVTHAHPECGNGVTWAVDIRRGKARQRLASGTSQGAKPVAIATIEKVRVRTGDLVSMVIGPRDRNHACDTTDIEFEIVEVGPDAPRRWSLTGDVAPNILAGNPHADRLGNADVWNFHAEPLSPADSGRPVIPVGSLLDQWLTTDDSDARQRLGKEIQSLINGDRPGAAGPNQQLWELVHDIHGGLLGPLLDRLAEAAESQPDVETRMMHTNSVVGDLTFGKPLSSSSQIAATDIATFAPDVITLAVPKELCAKRDFVVRGMVDPQLGKSASVQLRSAVRSTQHPVTTLPTLAADLPIVALPGSDARTKFVADSQDFRNIFPAALCYMKIVPVDEVVTIALYHREDENLCRLMLNDADKVELDKLWDELHFVSQDLLTVEDAYEQLMQYATQDSDPKLFEHLRQPIKTRADQFRADLLAAEPKHHQAILAFAERAYRRPLSKSEIAQFGQLYLQLRSEGLSHDAAIRLQLVRVLVSTNFLYRLEHAPAGRQSAALSDWEMAARLSYFLWSDAPDEELVRLASRGELRAPEVLEAQAMRMLRDPRARQLAREFACRWLDIRDIDQLNEKSERHFPEFTGIRDELQAEAEHYLVDLFNQDRSLLDLFESDYTFLNEELAAFYGVANVQGDRWRRVEGMQANGRGGVLTFGATLARQSGASRTSPILRGNWISEVLLGEKLPRPPKDVPQLPNDESTETLSMRQLVERHSSDARCANCHARIDAFGFAMEEFDAIGRKRKVDLGGHPVVTAATLPDGTHVSGADELRHYLVTNKRELMVRQFCRKLLGYALGRSVRLSDQQLLRQIERSLAENDYRVSVAVRAIVTSPQFTQIRGADAPEEFESQ